MPNKEAEVNLAGWKKALADYQNLQKETEVRLERLNHVVTGSLIAEILPIFDNFETALEHLPADQIDAPWAVGFRQILKMWHGFLDTHKVIKIKTVGEIFDPHIHEAIDIVSDPDKPDQEIIKEALAGYIMQDEVIRVSKVVVNNINIERK